MNTMSKFNQNLVLTGLVDFYCLTCETHIRGVAEVSSHIDKPIHQKNLNANPYLEKYKNDYIRKVKKGYYCQFCNVLVSTATRLSLHIADKEHYYNKGSQLVKRSGDVILAFDEICISDAAWNGFIEDTCAICNTEFDDLNIHKSEQTHTLNLVRSKLKFGNDNIVYRKIDDGSIQCLTCNIVLSTSTIDSHFESEDHKQIYKKCADQGVKLNIKNESNSINEGAADKTKNSNEHKPKKLDEKEEQEQKNIQGKPANIAKSEQIKETVKLHKEITEKNNAGSESSENKEHDSVENDYSSKILEAVSKFQKNDINIDFITNTAFCKKCYVNIEFRCESIDNHIEDHKKKCVKKENVPPQTISSGLSEDVNGKTLFTKPVPMKKEKVRDTTPSIDIQVQNYAKENGFTIHKNKMYCAPCESEVPPSIKHMKVHTDGRAHQKNVSKMIRMNRLQNKVQQKEFIKIFTLVNNPFSCNEIVINEKVCIVMLSFLMIRELNMSGFKCEACDIPLLSVKFLNEHKENAAHIANMDSCLIMAAHDTEFIREIQREPYKVYHCGFCNIIEFNWEHMEDHLETNEHIVCKRSANWRLQEHLPKIRSQSQEEENNVRHALMHMFVRGILP